MARAAASLRGRLCLRCSLRSLDEAKQRLSQGPKLDMEVSFHQMNMAKDVGLGRVGGVASCGVCSSWHRVPT